MSARPHGRLFMLFELRLEVTVKDDNHVTEMVEKLDELGVVESLNQIAHRIEESIPEMRVEVNG